VFTQGPIIRHVLSMTAAGSIGLVAVFVVDLLSLIYVSRLGDPKLTAAVGFGTQVQFFATSLHIGLAIAIGAVVSRALGAGKRDRARRLAGASLWLGAALSVATVAILLPLRAPILAAFGAQGETRDIAAAFLAITLPANILFSLGMSLSAILRAAGDARRSMYVTLFGGVATAILDPIFIFGLDLGVYGAAIVIVISRFVFAAVGWWGAARVHQLVGPPQRDSLWPDLSVILAVAGPAILTNIATPVGQSYAMRVFSGFGEQAVAAFAMIDRIVPVAFGVLFALSGSVGPIMGQNLGAGLYDRVRRVLLDCFMLTIVYVAAIWVTLWLGGPLVVALFGAKGEAARIVLFFCGWGVAIWFFLGGLFIANAAFNNLGYPLLSTLFNWGRATLGTIPFVTWGAHVGGPEGGLVGMVAGAALFGISAAATALWIARGLARRAANS
jgi:putative MATE family efflux protein